MTPGPGAALRGLSFANAHNLCAVQYDVLILGRGIAGAVLAEASRQRGLAAHVFDRPQPGSASLAAGGAVNPVVLRRMQPCWRAAALMPVARNFFGRWQQRLGIRCWHETPLVHVFSGVGEVQRWKHAMEGAPASPFITSRAEPEIDRAPFRASHGYGTVANAGWLDIPRLLEAQRAELLEEQALAETTVAPGEVAIEPHGVRIGSIRGRWLVDCTGPFHAGPGLSLVKGESLTVRIPGLELSRIVHGGIGLLPIGGGLFRAGSTFKWTDTWEGATEEARDWMLARLAELLDLTVEVVDHHAGVRPAAVDRKPIIGQTGPHQAMINGLGARGVMQAPWCAAHLLDHLMNGHPLDPEVDLSRFR